MKMMAIRLHYNMKRAVKRAILAGNDIVMIGLSYKKVDKIIKYIISQVNKGKIPKERIDKSVEKIINIKEKYNITDEKTNGFEINEINKQIEELNNNL